MVIVTGAAVGAVATFPPAVALFGQAGAIAAGNAVIPAAVAAAEAATAGAAVAGAAAAGAATAGAAVAGAAAGSLAAGAAGAATGAAVAGAGAGAVGTTVLALGEGAVVGLGVVGSGGSSSAGLALAAMAGPIGWAVVGCNNKNNYNDKSGYTWDCWKPVVRDASTRPSKGITLRCLAANPNVRSISLDQDGMSIRNIFGERFRLTPMTVEGKLAFHASVLCEGD